MTFAHRIRAMTQHPRARFAAMMSTAQGLNGLSALLVFRWLDPLAMGYWSAAQLVTLPLDALKLGILSGLAREYPYLLGRGERERAHRLAEAALAHSLLMCGLGLLAVGGLALLSPDSGSARSASITAAIAWALVYYAQFVRSTFRSSAAFTRLGGIELGIALMGVVTLVLVQWLGFQGLLFRALLLATIASGVFFAFRPVRVRPRVHWIAIREMFQFGRHTYITGYMLLVGQQAERIALLTFAGGVEAVGLYTPVLGIWSLLQVIPNVLHASSYPQFIEAYGRDHDARRLLKGLLGQIRKTAIVMVFISAFAGVTGWTIVVYLLPKYSAAGLPIIIACCAGPFLSVRILATYYSALKRWPNYYIFTALQAVLPYLIISGLLMVMPPLVAAATGVAGAIAISSLSMLMLTLRFATAAARTK
jgi:O-antigen/teichoic acid export membrane protein